MSSPETSFATEFAHRKETVDTSVAEFAVDLRAEVETHDPFTQAAVESYLNLLDHGGKRVRGVLTMTGYGLVSGEDSAMIAEAAALIEAIHAYLLVFDDVADNSDTRRGGDTAHIAMRRILSNQGLSDSASAKLAVDMVHLGALLAQHSAHVRLLNLPVADDRKVLAMRILSERLSATGIGQLRDIAPLSLDAMSADEALRTAELKTALYTFLLPTQVGAALGGASAEQLDTLKPYGLHAGLAFQLHDDTLGLIGDPTVTGKPTNDIAEGKRTFTFLTALERAPEKQRRILRRALGNTALGQTDFQECLDIIRQTEALHTTTELIGQHTQIALKSLDTLPSTWNVHEIAFMRNIALAGLQRKS